MSQNWKKVPTEIHRNQIDEGLAASGYGEQLDIPADELPLGQDRDDLYLLAEDGLPRTLEKMYLDHAGLDNTATNLPDFPGIYEIHETLENNLPDALQANLSMIEVFTRAYILATKDVLDHLNVDVSNAPILDTFYEPPLGNKYDLNTG